MYLETISNYVYLEVWNGSWVYEVIQISTKYLPTTKRLSIRSLRVLSSLEWFLSTRSFVVSFDTKAYYY